MGLFDFVSKQFLDIIEWEDQTQDTLVHKFAMADNEIQNGGKLIVRPGQAGIFVNEGQIADVFREGTHLLTTQNLPVLGDLKGWAYGFKSPFKADVYFVNTKQFLDQKWGTPHPILVADPKFEQVQLRAFGTFGFAVTDPKIFVGTVSSTNREYKVDAIREQLKEFIVTNFAPILAQQKVTVAELAANYNIINEALQAAVKQSFGNLGIEMTLLTISNISLPEEIQAMLNERTRINMMGGMDNYTRVRQLDVMETAAGNEGGGAGMMQAGLGMGAGMAMGQTFAQTMGTGFANQNTAPMPQQPAPGAPAPAPAAPAASGMVCSNCASALAASAMFCSICGTKVVPPEPAPTQDKFCSQCGNKVEANALFCSNCGNKM
ncbi:MAG TPA: SPFH domain-containing protein [Syntrophomonadaceae bacterium]|nr:SPFH domain-containing protein [Syntrophomonadaceae bacterium]